MKSQRIFKHHHITYKAVAHCFCGLVTNVTAGPHEIRYKTVIEGTGGIAEGKGSGSKNMI